MMERKMVYLVNPISGTSKKDGIKKLIEKETTARSIAFEIMHTNAGGHYELLREKIRAEHVTDVVIIGGDGSFRGAQKFSNEHDIPCIGLPGTIDKDIAGSDFTIGFDTAVNTAVQAIDKIRDTASSHNRLFFVEVMGRDAGYIALHSGIATGAENILIPETKTDIEELIASLSEKEKRKKIQKLLHQLRQHLNHRQNQALRHILR